MSKIETILIKGTFEQLGAIELFPYSGEAIQITRRNDGYNKLIFSADGFEFHRNFVDGEPMKETKVIILDDFVSTGLPNDYLDEIFERINVFNTFNSEGLYFVGNYEVYVPEKLSADLSVIYVLKDGGYYQPKVLFSTKGKYVYKVVDLQLFSKDIYSLRKYVKDNKVEIIEYVKEGKYSLDTYIAGFGEQERERLSCEASGIISISIKYDK